MADTEKTETEKTGDDASLREAEKRAKDAERKVREYEAAAKKREADENAAKESAKIRDLDDAKAKLEAAQKREAEAMARVKEFEDRERARVDALFERLSEETRSRLEKFRGKLSTADFGELVADESSRSPGLEEHTARSEDYPPIASPGGRKQGSATRQLHPKTEEILDQLGQDPSVARELVDVERDGQDKWKARHIYSAKKLVLSLRERAMQPKRMNAENLEKVLKAGKVFGR